MSSEKNRDCLDSLLYAAAKSAGARDLAEYNESGGESTVPAELAEKLTDIATGRKKKSKKGHIGFRRFAVIAAAMMIVCGFTIAGIAGKKQGSAPVEVTDKAGRLILSYDTNGISSDGKGEHPEGFPAEYGEAMSITDNFGNRGTLCVRDGVEYRYFVRKLESGYSLDIGDADTAEYFEFLVAGKYNGCVAVTSTEDGMNSTVCWNDGVYAFELYGNCSSDVICLAAQDLYR